MSSQAINAMPSAATAGLEEQSCARRTPHGMRVDSGVLTFDVRVHPMLIMSKINQMMASVFFASGELHKKGMGCKRSIFI